MQALVAEIILLTTEPPRTDESNDLIAKAGAALQKKDYEKALTLAEKAVAADPKNPEAVFVRGEVRMEQREFDKAIADFTKAIQLYPKSAAAFNALRPAHFNAGEINK